MLQANVESIAAERRESRPVRTAQSLSPPHATSLLGLVPDTTGMMLRRASTPGHDALAPLDLPYTPAWDALAGCTPPTPPSKPASSHESADLMEMLLDIPVADAPSTPNYWDFADAQESYRRKCRNPAARASRLPLRDYLGVSRSEYLRVRRYARQVVSELFVTGARMSAQPQEKVLEACNRMETQYPALAQCSQHWKSVKMLKQIVDNREDRYAKGRDYSL